jgi:hypothetical protein
VSKQLSTKPKQDYLDRDDPVQRVLGFLYGFRVAYEVQDLAPVAPYEAATQCQDPSGIFVIDPVASLAEPLLGLERLIVPRPAPLVEQSAALRTDRGIRQLEPRLVGIVDVFADQPVTTLPTNRKVSLFHVAFP